MSAIQDALAQIAAAEKTLATERLVPLKDLIEKAAASSFKEIAIDLRAVKQLLPRAEDQQVFENFAVTLDNVEGLLQNAFSVTCQVAGPEAVKEKIPPGPAAEAPAS